MNYIERYFKRKEKALKKNQSLNNLSKSKLLKDDQKKCTNKNSSIEINKEEYIHSKDEKEKNNESKDEFEIFKQQQYEIRVNNLKLKRFSIIYLKEKLENAQLKNEKSDKNKDNIFKRKANIKYKNMNMYNCIISKNSIQKKQYKLININKDRNCFYKCVSYFLYGTIAYHREVRNTISNVCKANLEELSDFQEDV